MEQDRGTYRSFHGTRFRKLSVVLAKQDLVNCK
jgi:hypothetical protein